LVGKPLTRSKVNPSRPGLRKKQSGVKKKRVAGGVYPNPTQTERTAGAKTTKIPTQKRVQTTERFPKSTRK